jgi:hypothetical protein
MLIIGCDYHPSVQQIAFGDTETGECGEQRLSHSDGEAEKFYRDLKLRAVSVWTKSRDVDSENVTEASKAFRVGLRSPSLQTSC